MSSGTEHSHHIRHDVIEYYTRKGRAERAQAFTDMIRKIFERG